MKSVVARIRKLFGAKEDGAAMVEYGLLVALIAAVCIIVTQLMGQEVSSVFGYLTTSLNAVI